LSGESCSWWFRNARLLGEAYPFRIACDAENAGGRDFKAENKTEIFGEQKQMNLRRGKRMKLYVTSSNSSTAQWG
jgi:hypothetical protein